MRADTYAGQLLAALARDTPAFAPSPRTGRAGFRARLRTAFTGRRRSTHPLQAGWQDEAATADVGPGLPPPQLALRDSAAAAELLLRGESELAALAAMARTSVPDLVADALRSAMAPAAEVVDGLRLLAARVAACEAAACAAANPMVQRRFWADADALLVQMRDASAGLSSLLHAATDLVAAAVPPGGHSRLDDEIPALRALAAGMRDVTTR